MFEDNLNYALCIAESAADPAHPVSPVEIIVEDVYHTPVADSWGPSQVIEVLARKELTLGLSYGINNDAGQTAGFTEALGGTYNYDPGVYFSKYRAVINGQAVGDSVTYSINGGADTLGPYTYTVTGATGNPVLIISAEDYTGTDPVYEDQTGPNYLNYYTNALDAAGYGYDVYDVSAHAAAPSPIEVLSHYDVAIWYTGDDYIPTVPGPGIHEDIFLNLRDYMNYDGGKLFATGQDIAYPSSYAGDFSDDFFQYYLGAIDHVEEGGMSAGGVPYDVKGEAGDPVFDGLNFSLYGGDGADNQYYTDTFLPASYFLPHFDQGIAAGYERPAGSEESGFPEGAAMLSPNSLYLGFGFEAIDTAANRAEIMRRVMQYFMPWSVINPDIKVNGQDGPGVISPGTPISIDISLNPGDRSGDNADWWIAEISPASNVNCFDINTMSFTPGLKTSYQGPLVAFSNIPLPDLASMTSGTHTFYFVVDMNMNNILDVDEAYYDIVSINIDEQ